MRFDRPLRGRQHGVIIVWFALFLLTMLGFVALGIDIAKMAATRTQLQNAADAAALAGASAIDPTTGRILRDGAVARAQLAASKNEAFVDVPRPIALDESDIEVIEGRQVRVTVRRQGANAVVSSMARVLGFESLEVVASATAEIDTADVTCSTVPLGFMPQPEGAPLRVGCGNTYVFKRWKHGGASGWYRPLLLPPCFEGPCGGMDMFSVQTFECLMKNQYACCLSIKEWVFLERQDWTPPLRRAIDARFDADTDKREGICFGQYRGNNSRLMIVPITTTEIPGDAGVWVNGVVGFFIKGRLGMGASAPLVGEFVHVVTTGHGGGHANGVGGATAYVLRLAR